MMEQSGAFLRQDPGRPKTFRPSPREAGVFTETITEDSLVRRPAQEKDVITEFVGIPAGRSTVPGVWPRLQSIASRDHALENGQSREDCSLKENLGVRARIQFLTPQIPELDGTACASPASSIAESLVTASSRRP
jgi:hypothetical protein